MCFLLLAILPAAGASPSATFEDANQLYEQGQYRAALQVYSNLLATGQMSAALYFNLGNACYKAGQVGHAIAAYRQAMELAPRDPDIRANLMFARKTASGQEDPPLAGWWPWLRRFSLNEWTVATALALWGWLGLMTAWQLQPAWRKSLGTPASLCLGLFLAAASCLGVRWNDYRSHQTGIVVVKSVQARMGPYADARSAFPLTDGMELSILGYKNNWVEVRDASQRIGWLEKENLLVLPGRP